MCASDAKAMNGHHEVRRAVTTAMAAVLMLCTGSAMAQKADREQEQLRRLREQVRQMQQEQGTLQTAAQAAQAEAAREKAAAEGAVKSAKAQAASQQGALSRRVSAMAAELATLTQDKTRLTEEAAQLRKQLDEAQAALKQRDELARLADTKATGIQTAQAKSIDSCRSTNAELYTLGTELLGRYERKGVGEVLGSSEPFFQLARVRLENTRAEYADKLDALKLKAVVGAP
jgi:DNA repair exonuclease SbcCD ATPase subunit